MQARNTTVSDAPTIEIFVAAKAIEVGEEVTPEKIRLEQWPADRIPEGSVGDLALLEGKYAKQKFYAGEPVMPVKLMDNNTATIPKGFSVVSLKADAENSISNLIQPGDRVNVVAYFTKSEIIPRTMTQTVLKGVRIFAVDGVTDRKEGDERPKMVRTIQLLVHSGDVDAWTYANELGKIRLSLGNPGDYDDAVEQDGPSSAGQEFLKWLADHQAAQEAARLALDEEEDEPQPMPVTTVTKKKKGFKMIKMVEGRMVEYFIAENELPVILNDTGAVEQTTNDTPTTTQPVGPQGANSQIGAPPVGTQDYSYLNGENSPFFQPQPASPTASATGYGRN